MSPALMNLTEVAKALGVSTDTLYRHPEVLRRLQAKTPLGRKKYAGALVDRMMTDQSLTQFGWRAS